VLDVSDAGYQGNEVYHEWNLCLYRSSARMQSKLAEHRRDGPTNKNAIRFHYFFAEYASKLCQSVGLIQRKCLVDEMLLLLNMLSY